MAERIIDNCLMRKDEAGIWVQIHGVYADAVNDLSRLSDEGRLAVFSNFCTACGTMDLPCNCMRDE